MRRTKHVEELIEDDEQKPDFDDMMNEVQEEIEEHDAEDAVVSRAPELRQLSENIDRQCSEGCPNQVEGFSQSR